MTRPEFCIIEIELHLIAVQNAVDWLERHPDGVDESEATKASMAEDTEAQAQSLVCNDCQRQLRGVAEAEYHASKTGHENFAESTATIVPLTDEEKKAKLDAYDKYPGSENHC